MNFLRQKRVLITGASSGIGEACAYSFAREECSLVLVARRADRLAQLKKEISENYNVDVQCITLDVRNREEVFAKLSTIDPVDILINNAGLARGLEKVHNMNTDHIDEMINTNVSGLLYVTQMVVPKMIEMGKGDIINLGSIAGHEVYPGATVYCASKHAVDALTKGMRIDLADTPLRVSSIDPGAVNTEFSTVRFEGDTKKADSIYRGFRPLVAEDIAEIAVFIASRPAHVQIADVVVFPTAQASSMVFDRK